MHPQMVIIKAVLFIRRNLPRLNALIQRLGWVKVGLSALIIVAVASFLFMRDGASNTISSATIHSVTLKTVAELSSDVAPLSVVGQVTSKSEATVRAEHSGQVIAVHTFLGSEIIAGKIAAEIDNGSESASVLQAQGAVEAAQANLSKISGGARNEQRAILEANLSSARASLEAAKSGAVNALLSAYATSDSAISGTVDKMFTVSQLDNASFVVISSDSQLTLKIENTRSAVRQYLVRQRLASDSLSASSGLESEIAKTMEEVRSTRNFVDLVVMNLNKAIPTVTVSEAQIATFLAQATAARASLTGALSSLSGSMQGLAAAQSAVQVAEQSLEQGVTGGQSEDIASAKAALKQAKGVLAGAQANLEKTIIRAPISGTVNSFSLKRGDYVQQASPVLTVANNKALEVVAYVTEGDAREIAVGQRVTIESAHGSVTRIAPALDPITKKIEVRVGIEEAKGLINGQSVLVSIPRSQNVAGESSRITIPISSLKMESDRVIVFTVEENRLIAHEVVLGALLGDRVVIASGLTNEMTIVTDARGLREGEVVDFVDQGVSGGQ